MSKVDIGAYSLTVRIIPVSRMLILSFAMLCLVWIAFAQDAGPDLADRPYPQGDRFPPGLYSLNPDEDMLAARDVGWNIAHTYNFKAPFLDAAGTAGLFALGHIAGPSRSG